MYWITIKQGYDDIKFIVSDKDFINSLITKLIDGDTKAGISIEVAGVKAPKEEEPEEE